MPDASNVRATAFGFPPTRWELVRRTRADDGPETRAALDELCRAYWRPLYAYARGRGLARADAEDAVQGFFATALRRNLFQRAEPVAGKLRSFLLTSLKHHLQDLAAHAAATRRRPEGGWTPLDFEAAEAEWTQVASHEPGPERQFERQWARSLLAQADAKLEARYAAEGKAALLAALREEALGTAERPAEPPAKNPVAELSDGARRVAVHRLRKRFGEELRAAVADTLPEGGDIDEELRHLREALEVPTP